MSGARFTILLLWRSDHHAAVVNLLVIALQHYRARLAFVAVERASRDARNLRVINDSGAVENKRHPTADQRYVECLPLAGLLGGIARRRDEAVDSADSMTLGFLAVIVLN